MQHWKKWVNPKKPDLNFQRTHQNNADLPDFCNLNFPVDKNRFREHSSTLIGGIFIVNVVLLLEPLNRYLSSG